MEIFDGQTSSDILNGTAEKSWLDTAIKFVDETTQKIGLWIDGLTINGVRVGDWYRADPLSATAAAIGVGVVAYVAGSAIASLVGTGATVLTLVRSIGLSGSLRAAGGIAARGLQSGLAWVTGHAGALATRFVAGITAGAVLRWCVGGAVKLLNLNWNATDKELDNQIKSAQDALWGVAGSTFGNLLGNSLCGILPGAAVVRVNPAKLAAIKEINQELYEEMLPAVNSLVMASVGVVRVKSFTEVYKNTRRWIKSKSEFLRNYSPFWADVIKAWGEEGSKPWTINSAVEESIESISDAGIKAFAENAWEETIDSCTEALFVFSTAFG
jgi:hypothetical protein